MPMYSTRCTKCDDRKDVLVPRTTSDLPKCACGGDREHAVASSTGGFVLKGGGWYRPSRA